MADGPQEWRRETIRGLRANGWSWEGIARVYKVTVAAARTLAGEPRGTFPPVAEFQRKAAEDLAFHLVAVHRHPWAIGNHWETNASLHRRYHLVLCLALDAPRDHDLRSLHYDENELEDVLEEAETEDG